MPFFICHCHSASSQRLSLHLLFLSFFFFHPPSPSCRRSSNSPSRPLFAFHLLFSAACSSFSHISRPLPEPQSSPNVPAPCHNAPACDCAKFQERLDRSSSSSFPCLSCADMTRAHPETVSAGLACCDTVCLAFKATDALLPQYL